MLLVLYYASISKAPLLGSTVSKRYQWENLLEVIRFEKGRGRR